MNYPAASSGVSNHLDYNCRHSGLDQESRLFFRIPAFAGMTNAASRREYP